MTFSCTETSATSHTTLPSRILKRVVTFRGVGLFTGKDISLTLRSSAKSGIYFQRMDLPRQPLIPALAEFVKETPRCTILEKDGAVVRSPEHILSALKAFGIYDALIQIDGEEPPVGDGSATHFVELFKEAGIEETGERKEIFKLDKPLHLTHGDNHIVALPCDCLKLSYTLSYSGSELLEAQFFSRSIDQEIYQKEIAPSRTFSMYEEVMKLKEAGFLNGITLDNGIVIKGEEVLNPGGLHFSDEMVRHKVLDVLGDLALVGSPFHAHIISIRSGHALNTALAKMLSNHFRGEEFS